MAGPYVYTPQIWPLVFTVLALIALAMYSFHRRSVPGALPLAFALLFSMLWTIGIIMEVAAVDLSVKIFWVGLQTAMLLPTTTSVTCFVLEYAWPGRWLTRRNLALLSIPCLLYFAIILTNDLHHLAWQGFALDWRVIQMRGLGNWIFLIYGYGLTIINLVVLVWLFIHSPQQRWPAALMIAGQLGVRVLYMLGVLQVIHPSLPIEVLAFWIPIPIYFITLFGFRIFDPIPVARQAVIEQMRDGVLVLDLHGRVASLNPAASKILTTHPEHAKGKPIEEILPQLTRLSSDLIVGGVVSKQVEITINLGAEARCYELESSPLDDFRGIAVGRLLLLHDVTEQHRSQAQILEQQRALARSQEREWLARELHDSTSQILGYASLKLGAARQLIADDKLARADAQLEQLENGIQDAHADLREYILNLRHTPSGEKPFFLAVQHFLDGYHRNYGLQVKMSIGATMDESFFSTDDQLQWFRILQEALSNARKHSGTNCVTLYFEREECLVRMRVQDDGNGFENKQTSISAETHLGLRIMRERAGLLGGSLQIESSPGKGTCVIVEVPLDRKKE